MDELQASFVFTQNLTYVNTLLVMAVAITQIARFFRREPSLDTVIQNVADKFEKALKDYALSKDVMSYESRLSEEQRRMGDNIESIKDRSATKADLTALETRLGGRLDGMHESVVQERNTARQQSLDFQASISSLSTSTAILQNFIKSRKDEVSQ